MTSSNYLDLAPIARVNGTVVLPGSKSISNRALLLAALANGTSRIEHLLSSDDTHYMLDALNTLGIYWQQQDESSVTISGNAGIFTVRNATLFLGNAGTVFRPLTAVLAFSGGHYQLLGTARMYERPIGDLVDALRFMGAHIEYLGQTGFPPLCIQPAQLHIPRLIPIKSDISSQFLSSLLMALPLAGQPTKVKVVGKLTSSPYVAITLQLMAQFGISVNQLAWQEFVMPGEKTYTSPGVVVVEGDASSASYFLAAGAIAGGTIRVEGVGYESIQGDVFFATLLERMGARIIWHPDAIEVSPPLSGQLRALDVDLNAIPDAAMTLAVTALFAKGTMTIRNIASWQVKETNRLHAMATELRKVGASVEVGPNSIHITPAHKISPDRVIETYHDHRMAMCFSLIALGGVSVRILNPACTSKTFPDYFQVIAALSE